MGESKGKAMIFHLLFARIKVVSKLVFQSAVFIVGYNYFYKLLKM
jgi:hypothetical protein